jgi:hypothetical protein
VRREHREILCARVAYSAVYDGRSASPLGGMNTQHDASKPRFLGGSCLCGQVQYTVEDSFNYALNCHCSKCRRATGAAFKSFAGIERGKLKITSRRDDLLMFGDEVTHDVHCSKCGSLLYSVVRDGRFVHVTLGTLLQDPSVRPSAHIFVGSKAPWFTITDNLPQHEEFP